MDGAVKFNVSANTAQFDAAMRRVGSVAQTTGDRVRSAFSGLGGLLAGGAIVAGLQNILSKMDDISDRAKRFGVSAEEIQRVGNAADIVGTNFDAVARAINRTGVAANKAAREGGSVAEAFARVNLDPAAFAAASLEERIQMIGKAQQSANGDAQKMSDLFEVIGVKASNINFTELLAEMKQVNAASNETVETLAEANDRIEKMQQNATILGANLIKGISDYAEKVGSILGEGSPLWTKISKLALKLTPLASLADMAGFGGKTIKQMEEAEKKQAASDRLQRQGGLLLNNQGQPITAPRFSANTKESREQIAKAAENARRIDAEVARAEAERKSAENASRRIRTEGEEDPTEPVRKASIDVAARLKEIESIYQKEIQSINSSPVSLVEQTQARIRLDAQYLQAKRQAFGQMTTEAAQPEAARQRSDSASSAPASATSAEADKVATETTLQKVASFLEQLNTKLPQPVLV